MAQEVIGQELPEAGPGLPPSQSVEVTPEDGLFWGDGLAFQVWIVCCLLMGMIVLYDLIASLWHR